MADGSSSSSRARVFSPRRAPCRQRSPRCVPLGAFPLHACQTRMQMWTWQIFQVHLPAPHRGFPDPQARVTVAHGAVQLHAAHRARREKPGHPDRQGAGWRESSCAPIVLQAQACRLCGALRPIFHPAAIGSARAQLDEPFPGSEGAWARVPCFRFASPFWCWLESDRRSQESQMLEEDGALQTRAKHRPLFIRCELGAGRTGARGCVKWGRARAGPPAPAKPRAWPRLARTRAGPLLGARWARTSRPAPSPANPAGKRGAALGAWELRKGRPERGLGGAERPPPEPRSVAAACQRARGSQAFSTQRAGDPGLWTGPGPDSSKRPGHAQSSRSWVHP